MHRTARKFAMAEKNTVRLGPGDIVRMSLLRARNADQVDDILFRARALLRDLDEADNPEDCVTALRLRNIAAYMRSRFTRGHGPLLRFH